MVPVAEYTNIGCRAGLDAGEISVSYNYRPVKALCRCRKAHKKDGCFDQAAAVAFAGFTVQEKLTVNALPAIYSDRTVIPSPHAQDALLR